MEMENRHLFSWQRLPILDYPDDVSSSITDTNSDLSLPEPPLTRGCDRPILDVEESTADTIDSTEIDLDEGDSRIGDDQINTREAEFGPAKSDVSSPTQVTRRDLGSVLYLDDGAKSHPYDEYKTVPNHHINDPPKLIPISVKIPPTTLTQPRSIFEGFTPPATQVPEHDALASLLEAIKENQSLEEEQDDFIEFDLQDFCVYIHTEHYINELKPLQHITTRFSKDYMYFDGVLSFGEKRFFLKKIPFRELPMGNYGKEEHTVGDQIWIRSASNERKGTEIYYKLGNPSVEYKRFFKPFLWIADLTKHVVDYLEYMMEKRRRACLDDFKSRFSSWLLRTHSDPVFHLWHSANRGDDFRSAIIANLEFIFKEAYGVDPRIISWHAIWEEIKTYNWHKPNLSLTKSIAQSRNRKKTPVEIAPTIATPYVYNLFSHMVFGKVLKEVRPPIVIESKRSAFVHGSPPAKQRIPSTIRRDPRNRKTFIASIQVGDVISTKPDDHETDTKWQRQKSKHFEGEYLWFGLVQDVHRSNRGDYSFDVLWLYQPIDTPCGIMKYPYHNELFLSNNCTCHHDTAKVQADEVLATHNIEWFGEPSTSAEYFVRQTYLSDDCRWTTLRQEHLTCAEDKFHTKQAYKVGDFVLVETDQKALRLECFVVEAFFEEGEKKYATLRKLLRRKNVDKTSRGSPPNELVYTNRLVDIPIGSIFRHCLVRAFQAEEKIPTPYDRDGTGDLFFMTHQEIQTGEGEMTYVPLDQSLLHELRPGFDPPRTPLSQKLQGLDLFCGGGNFGRGLEEGGGIQMRWANDIATEALHTYMANADPDVCTPFLGSVDDLLLRAIEGTGDKIPRPGDVQFISAGSPCPGFSLLTPDRTTDDQRKNQSLVASFASFVDFYRPYYGVLENVPQMVHSKSFRDACVFSQLMCALVGLGYQAQVMFLDAWSFGTPQSRSRVFLCFSAPGFRMPRVPAPSHSHPSGTRLVGLGEMSSGRPFDSREIVSTPFHFVDALQAIGDLPDIQDGKADYCVGYPDHRMAVGVTPPVRKQLFQIPTQPWAMSFSKAWYGRPGLPPVFDQLIRRMYPHDKAQRVWKGSKGWARVHPYRLLSTIATKCLPTDARMGYTNHWYQTRPLTILEVRRAQGFRDDEVIIGTPAVQWRIVGNSVARQVSVAIGLAFREAWFGTLFDEPFLPQTGLAAFATAPFNSIATAATSTTEHGFPFQSPRPLAVGDISYADTETDDGVAIAQMEIEEVGTRLLVEDSEEGSDTLSEESFLLPTPMLKSASLTPATSESVEGSESEVLRKREGGSLYVETLSKRQRLDGYGRCGSEGVV
ncbi:hypothetical protein M426DRAFT_94434 [Hypoxylon sp. CI-4A]|nr:hypothetical protein M426DRAFT_94434 [Hypoxylon sp. CI-4A]